MCSRASSCHRSLLCRHSSRSKKPMSSAQPSTVQSAARISSGSQYSSVFVHFSIGIIIEIPSTNMDYTIVDRSNCGPGYSRSPSDARYLSISPSYSPFKLQGPASSVQPSTNPTAARAAWCSLRHQPNLVDISSASKTSSSAQAWTSQSSAPCRRRSTSNARFETVSQSSAPCCRRSTSDARFETVSLS